MVRGREHRERAGAAGAVALVHVLLVAVLLHGLGSGVPAALESPLRLIDLAPPPPPAEAPRPPPRVESADPDERFAPGEEGAAAPPDLRAEPTPVVAPPPVVPLPVTPPIPAAPLGGTGRAPSAGAAEVRGPGPGAGGSGDGRGAGAGGGGGGGGGFGRGAPPRLIRGRLSDSDYPAAAGEAGIGGLVGVRFTVALDGRAVNCRITRSSGSAELDAHTCRLIERRYLFRPARDGRGRPVLSDVVENHEWVVEDLPPEPPRR